MLLFINIQLTTLNRLCTALHRVGEERNILHTIKRRKANWIGHILGRICLLDRAIAVKVQRKTEGTGRRGRRPEHLLDYLKETRRRWNLKDGSLDRTLWGTRLGRGVGPVVGRTTW